MSPKNTQLTSRKDATAISIFIAVTTLTITTTTSTIATASLGKSVGKSVAGSSSFQSLPQFSRAIRKIMHSIQTEQDLAAAARFLFATLWSDWIVERSIVEW